MITLYVRKIRSLWTGFFPPSFLSHVHNELKLSFSFFIYVAVMLVSSIVGVILFLLDFKIGKEIFGTFAILFFIYTVGVYASLLPLFIVLILMMMANKNAVAIVSVASFFSLIFVLLV